MPRFIDLSAPIVPSPPETPDPLRTEIVFQGHEAGAAAIEALLGVGRELLRDGEGWAVEEFTRFGTHNSTHVDAPWHYNSTIAGERAQTIDELPLEWFHAPGVVLDFSHKADGEAVTVPEIDDALAALDRDIQPLDIVLIRTGRDAFLDAPDYMIKGPGVTATTVGSSSQVSAASANWRSTAASRTGAPDMVGVQTIPDNPERGPRSAAYRGATAAQSEPSASASA